MNSSLTRKCADMKKISTGLIIQKNKVNTCNKLIKCELVHRKRMFTLFRDRFKVY